MACKECESMEKYINKFRFHINVEQGTHAANIMMSMEPGRHVMSIAEALSKQYVGKRVTVEGHVRIRRTYLDGEIVDSSPDIHKFYKGMTSQDQWEWTCYGQCTD